ncbi:MAG: HlyD family efflux transporter periplasmic adaptor subunit [Thermoflexia bacterium]|nr:MAG: HlyD family efflux transporter periplasmic adaptor subunit [Thermoflexia bacterium]
MLQQRWFWPGVLLALLVALAGAWALSPSLREWASSLFGQAQARSPEITASGFLEAETIRLAPEVGGRIVEIAVAEGEEVTAGQILVRLDDRIARAQVAMAEAGLEVAQARLALARAGACAEDIRRAEALLAQAEALRDGAYQAWQDARALLANPQDLEARIAQLEAQVHAQRALLDQAVALKDLAEGAYNQYRAAMGQWESIPEPLRPPLSPDVHGVLYAYWQAWAGVNAAGAAYDGARETLGLLYQMRKNPLALRAQVNAAEAQYRAAEAAVDMARAQLEGLRAGATAEEIAALEAQVQQARAQVEGARVALDKLTLTAPAGGVILELAAHEGELALPGVPLLTLADLEEVRLTVYVPENRLGQVQVGQRVEVRVDSFPDRVFLGRVASIATQAEFTPRNIQTAEERVNMVFAVRVLIPNPDRALKPGILADARILIGE